MPGSQQEVKDVLEKVIQEKRIWRSILDNLHWGDEADKVYADIMDKQLELKYLEKDFWGKVWLSVWDDFIYKKCFGWDVRILNPIVTGVFSIFVFALLYILLDDNFSATEALSVYCNFLGIDDEKN